MLGHRVGRSELVKGKGMPQVLLVVASMIAWPVLCLYTHAAFNIISWFIAVRREHVHVHAVIVLPFVLVRDGGALRLMCRLGERLLSGTTGLVLTAGDWTLKSDVLVNQQRRLTCARNIVYLCVGTLVAIVITVGFAASELAWQRVVYWASIPSVVTGWTAATIIWNWSKHGRLSAVPLTDQTLAMLRIQWASFSGIRPRDWDVSWVNAATEFNGQSPMEMSAHSLAYAYALDSGDINKARFHLDAALTAAQASKSITIYSCAVLRAAAWFAARHDQDPAGARRYLDQARMPSIDIHGDACVEAGVLLAEGEFGRARQAAQRGLAHLRPTLDSGSARMDEDFLREILDHCSSLKLDTSSHPHAQWN
jgi:hypothetical protein